MKKTLVQCSCDSCGESMTESEYSMATQVTIRIDLPNPKHGSGQCAGIDMRICNKCSAEIGIVNSKEYHDYMYSQSRLRSTIRESKNKILKFFFKAKDEI